VEYKDIAVTAPDGHTLLTADLASDTRGWRFTGGKWDLQDKAIRPSADAADSWALTGDPTWTDYTIRLRARKVGGAGGFAVIWHAIDANSYERWVVGGNNNAIARCESITDGNREAYGPTNPFTVETGR